MTDELRFASIITAPPDDCPNCLTHQVTPYKVTLDGGNLYGYYRCTACDYPWNTGWKAETVSPRGQD